MPRLQKMKCCNYVSRNNIVSQSSSERIAKLKQCAIAPTTTTTTTTALDKIKYYRDLLDVVGDSSNDIEIRVAMFKNFSDEDIKNFNDFLLNYHSTFVDTDESNPIVLPENMVLTLDIVKGIYVHPIQGEGFFYELANYLSVEVVPNNLDTLDNIISFMESIQ